jgi:hypothetical protein
MKDRKDSAAAPLVATTSSTLNDNQERRDTSTENVSQRSRQLGLKTSKSGFPIAKAAVLGRTTERPSSAFRRITTAPKSKVGSIAGRLATSTSAPAAKLKPAPRLISPAHLKSVQKAAKAFENFSLSKFATNKIPENYVHPRKVRDPKTIQDVQRELISRQLRNLPDKDTLNSGMAITLPVANLEEVKKALPGISEHGGQIELDDLLTYLRRRMNGTTFYSRGNLAIKRLTAGMQARSQARAIIERVKAGSREKGRGAARTGAMQTSAGSKNLPGVQVLEKKGGSKS